MYALSSIAMQHRELFYGAKNRVAPDFEFLREEGIDSKQLEGLDARQTGGAILKQLNLEGAHNTRGKLEDGRIEINRHRPIGSYRIFWQVDSDSVTLEKQGFGMTYFLEMLHRRRGFNQPYWANDAWAVIVDLVIVAILTWAFTGLWMWWKMRSTHKLGSACVFAGSILFAFFVLMI